MNRWSEGLQLPARPQTWGTGRASNRAVLNETHSPLAQVLADVFVLLVRLLEVVGVQYRPELSVPAPAVPYYLVFAHVLSPVKRCSDYSAAASVLVGTHLRAISFSARFAVLVNPSC